MQPTRRHVLTRGSAALAALGLGASASAQEPGGDAQQPAVGDQDAAPQSDARAPKLLVLGGTKFLGPSVVHAALERGFEVTLFNRGRSAPEMFKELEQLRGDRDPLVGDGLSALEGDRRWDYVIDTSSYVPRHTRAAAELLAGRIERYALISTVSVYPELGQVGIDEGAPVGRLDDPTIEEVSNSSYGPLKALCEEAAEAALPGRVVNVRPGLIVGPRDTTARFGFWPVRVREGGEMLAPGAPDDPVQFIDVDDLAEFTLNCLTEGHVGVFNAVGPIYGATIANLLHGCRAVVTADTRFTWVDAGRCEQAGLHAWGELPVWSDPGGSAAGINQISAERAIAAGLTSRPVADTVRRYLEWYGEQPAKDRQGMRGGMSPEQEQRALRS